MAWKRRVKRVYRPGAFREANAAVARLMRELEEKADREGWTRVCGRWVKAGEGGRAPAAG